MAAFRWQIVIVIASIVVAAGMVLAAYLVQPAEWAAYALPMHDRLGGLYLLDTRTGETWYIFGSQKCRVEPRTAPSQK